MSKSEFVVFTNHRLIFFSNVCLRGNERNFNKTLDFTAIYQINSVSTVLANFFVSLISSNWCSAFLRNSKKVEWLKITEILRLNCWNFGYMPSMSEESAASV